VKPFWGLHGSFHIAVSMTEARAPSQRSKPSAVEFYRALQQCRDIESCAALFKGFVAAYNVDVFACGEVECAAPIVILDELPRVFVSRGAAAVISPARSAGNRRAKDR